MLGYIELRQIDILISWLTSGQNELRQIELRQVELPNI